MNLLYGDESYAIIGACFEVYKEKGNGFLEAVYQECLEVEFAGANIPFAVRQLLNLTYKGVLLKQRFIPDFFCFEKIIVELKAVREVTDEHRAQVLNYLKATGMRLGLLVNFGHFPKLQYERIIL